MLTDNKIGYMNTAYTLQGHLPNISPFGLIWALKVPFLCFSHLNKLGPLVANFKIGYVNSVHTIQDQGSQITTHLD